jgi:hypothetical protein
MPVVKEVTVVTRYTDAQGNEKKRYHNVGVVMSTKNGDMLKLESLPIGWDGWAYLNDPREREDKPVADKPRQAAPRNQNAGSRSSPMAQAPADDFDDSDLSF